MEIKTLQSSFITSYELLKVKEDVFDFEFRDKCLQIKVLDKFIRTINSSFPSKLKF